MQVHYSDISFKEALAGKAMRERERISHMESVKLNWENPIALDFSKIPTSVKNGKTYELHLIPNFELLVALRNKPAVYYFELNTNEQNAHITKKLGNAKSQQDSRALPKIHKVENLSTHILYVGSVRNNLHMRFAQHLGLYTPSTYALHLVHWFPKDDLEIKYHYAILDDELRDLSKHIESVLADVLNPLVGKRSE